MRFLLKFESDFLLIELLRAILRRKPFLTLPPCSVRPSVWVKFKFTPGLTTAKSSLTSRWGVGRRSSSTSEVLNRCPALAFEERRLRILLVSLRENLFVLSSSSCSSASFLASVGEGMGLSLVKGWRVGLSSGVEITSGGGIDRRLDSGLFGSEHDL